MRWTLTLFLVVDRLRVLEMRSENWDGYDFTGTCQELRELPGCSSTIASNRRHALDAAAGHAFSSPKPTLQSRSLRADARRGIGARHRMERALSSVGRASRLHRGGRRFEPVSAHHPSDWAFRAGIPVKIPAVRPDSGQISQMLAEVFGESIQSLD